MTPGRLTQLTRLDNGLRVATESIPGIATASVGLWVGAGARYETAEVNGVAHLLEHMLFKGTPRRDARRIAVEIEDVGGQLNAYTGRETTAYYARVLAEDAPLAIDMIADMVSHATMDETELARERKVVIQEIGQVADTPDDIIFDHFQQTAYPDQPLGRPVLGTLETVGGLGRTALFDYRDRHYAPENAILIATGAVDHDRIVELARAHLGDLPRPGIAPPAPAARYAGGTYREEQDLEQLHLVLGFEGVSFTDPAYYAMNVYSTLIGGGMSSRLFQEIRENRGLVYSIHSFAAPYADGGLFGVYAGTGEEEVRELVPVLCDELMASTAKLEPGELERAKAQLKAALLMSMENPSGRAEQLGQQILLFGHPLAPEDIIAHVEAVNEDAVRDVAIRMLTSPPTIAAMGPLGALESDEAIRQRLRR